MNSKNCNNCAWYCHADGKCYGAASDGTYLPLINTGRCKNWAADGLSDEEREELDALVTME